MWEINLDQYKQKDVVNPQFKAIVTATRQLNENTANILILENKCLDQFKKMTESQANECSELLSKAVESYHNSLAEEIDLLDNQKRAIEDLHDIQERFLVVVRTADKYKEAQKAFTKATDNLEASKKKMASDIAKDPSKQETWNINIEKSKNQARDALKTLTESLKKLIEEKKKFNHFRIQRMKHSYRTYGNATNEYSKKLIDAYADLKNQIDLITLDVNKTITNSKAE